ncbi:hypothetical protein AB0H92_01755 [Streptomyces phaeochromogenes]|uniref:hypothetical protein n=1 Tax=Streptomyces phaeochromogenes TaxID=1923 RepID=UPI003410F0CE
MGVRERERKVYGPLRRAGLEVIPNAVPDGTMPFVLGYGAEDVTGGFSHRYDTPPLVERLNADWYDLAVSSGLLDHRREFPVQLPQGTRTHRAALRNLHGGSHTAPAVWTRVRLLERWDIMGRDAASAFLGVHAGHPDRSANILRHLEWITLHDSLYVHREFKQRIAAWLADRRRSAA